MVQNNFFFIYTAYILHLFNKAFISILRMSFCASQPPRNHICQSRQVLKTTANRLRTILQGWMACFVNAPWMDHQHMFDQAQEGGLLYPPPNLKVLY